MSNKFEPLLEMLEKAIGRLQAVLKERRTDIVRDSAIQRFEFNYELVWKTLKAFLEGKKGIRATSPKDRIKEAFQQGLLEDDPLWLDTVTLRNSTALTYDETTADRIYAALPRVLKLYQNLLARLKKES